MASPDFRNYIDLTLYDVDPLKVYNDAIAYAQTAVPQFSPRLGSLEDAIMQAVAYNTATLIAAINRLPDGLMEGIAALTGLSRKEATFSTGVVEVTVYVTTGVTIPSGSVFSYETLSDDVATSYLFQTTEDLIIATSSTTGTVPIQALTAGKYPLLLTGQELELLSPLSTVTSVILDEDLVSGTDNETDSEYFNRAVQHFASLSQCLTTKVQMANYIKSTYANCPYFGIFDLTDSTALGFAEADAPGYVTIVAVDPTGSPLSTGDKNDLLDDLESKSVAGLNIGIVDSDDVDIEVECEYALMSGYTSLAVTTAVEDLIQSELSYKGYDFSGSIIKNQLISKLSQIPGVKYVASLTFTSGDGDYNYADGVVTFDNKNNVPNPTPITVTVV